MHSLQILLVHICAKVGALIQIHMFTNGHHLCLVFLGKSKYILPKGAFQQQTLFTNITLN